MKITETAQSLNHELENLGLKDVIFRGEKGQALWTVGDWECDIVVVKANISYGPQFAILKKDS